jgi:peptide/nickel transport system substrate-binding protein
MARDRVTLRTLGSFGAGLALMAASLVAVGARPAVAAPDGTITWGVHITLASRWLDPAETEGIITPFMVLYALHDALVKPMPAGANTPSLAESWTQSKDGLTYEFVLRKGVKFHNGDPVTAEDVKFSFDRYRGSGARILKDRVREFRVVDPGRVRIHLKEPWPDFMTFYGTSATGAGWIVPKKYVEKVGDDGFKKAPVGAGPYRFVSFNPGVELVLEAYEGYWRKTPVIKRLVLRSLPEETTRAAALKKGEVDIAYLFSGPVAEDIRRSPGFKLTAPNQSNGVFWIDLPDQWDPKSPWHDRRVRLAASHAIDRKALNQAETLGFSRLTGGIIPRSFEYAKVFEPPPFDPARAKQLLAEAGFPNGFDAGDLYPWPPYTSMGEALGSYLQQVGIRTRIRTMERATLTTAWREKKLKGVIVGITGAAGNAATRLEAYVSKEGIYSAGVIPEVEDLFQRQARELDTKKREALLHQIQQILHDRVTHVPIYELAFIWGIGPRVEEPGINLIKGYAYSAPYEDLKLKKQ